MKHRAETKVQEESLKFKRPVREEEEEEEEKIREKQRNLHGRRGSVVHLTHFLQCRVQFAFGGLR